MGIGWVQVSEDEKDLIFKGRARVGNWPSSTRPELLAILCALFTVVSNSKVQIKTDSAAAILAIRDALNEKSFNKGLKRKNRTILDKITEIVHFKSLNLELIKVKAHSGIKWNEVADCTAKEGPISMIHGNGQAVFALVGVLIYFGKTKALNTHYEASY